MYWYDDINIADNKTSVWFNGAPCLRTFKYTFEMKKTQFNALEATFYIWLYDLITNASNFVFIVSIHMSHEAMT